MIHDGKQTLTSQKTVPLTLNIPAVRNLHFPSAQQATSSAGTNFLTDRKPQSSGKFKKSLCDWGPGGQGQICGGLRETGI